MIPGQYQPRDPGGDALDELIRQTLQRNTSSAQPPKRIWERIRSQVTAGPAPASHRPPAERLGRLLTPFVQGLAAVALFILVGVSLVSTRWTDPRQVETISPQPGPVTSEPSAPPTSAVSIQRLARLDAVEDAFDLGLSRSPVRRQDRQIERVTRLSMASGDPDRDLVLNSRYATGRIPQ